MDNTLIILFLCILLVYVFCQRYPQRSTAPQIQQIKERLRRLDPRFADLPIYIDDSAYTINKRTVYICLYDKETGQVFDINTLMYVTLHELGHVVTTQYESDEHGPIFRKNFANLLKMAAQRGIYDPSLPLPQSYCGAK